MRHVTKTWLTLCLVSVVAAACAATAAARPAQFDATQHQSRATVDTIEYAMAVYSGAYWGIYAAQAEGFFAKQNLNVHINIIASSPLILSAMEGGSIQMSSAANDSTVLAVSNGAKVALVAGIQRVSALQFVTSPGISQISELKGKSIGGTNLSSSDALFARIFLQKHGLADRDFSMVALGTFPNRAAGVLNGQVKAAMLTEPWTSQLVAAGAKNWGSANEIVGNNFNFLNVAVAKPWAASHPGEVVRFLKAYSQGVDWLYQPKNKAAAIKILEADPINLTADQATVTYNAFIGGKTKVLSPILTEKDILWGVRLARSENLPTASTTRSLYWNPVYWQKAHPAPKPAKKK
jgi:ABC-type nitrate/sulfonate/bicarbonate transport system substrate-binding protein